MQEVRRRCNDDCDGKVCVTTKYEIVQHSDHSMAVL